MFQTASTPPTTPFRGGNISDESLSASRAVCVVSAMSFCNFMDRLKKRRFFEGRNLDIVVGDRELGAARGAIDPRRDAWDQMVSG